MGMKLNINGGSMEITDDNQTIVSANIAEDIRNNYQQSDKKEWEQPELQIKD